MTDEDSLAISVPPKPIAKLISAFFNALESLTLFPVIATRLFFLIYSYLKAMRSAYLCSGLASDKTAKLLKCGSKFFKLFVISNLI